MADLKPQEQSLYGLPVPVTSKFPPPVIAKRPPIPSDTGYPLGQMWIDKISATAYILVLVAGGIATWIPVLGGGVGVQTINGFLPVLSNFNFTNLGGLSISAAAGVFSAAVDVDSPVVFLNGNLVSVQTSSAAGVSNPLLNGVCHFDTTQFTVDANGFVQITAGGLPFDEIFVDAATAPGVNPVIPDGFGGMTINGVLAPAQNVPLRTHTTGANNFYVEAQVSSAQAVSSFSDNGMSHFNSAHFSVDADGFVSSVVGTVGWLNAVAPQALANHYGYYATAPGVYTLPAGVADGDIVEIIDVQGGGVIVTASGADVIQISNIASTPGGTATSTLKGDSLRLVFRLADVTWWSVPGASGNWILA